MQVIGIDVALCECAIGQSIRLGSVEYSSRDYVAVRLRTEDPNVVGYAAGGGGVLAFEGARRLAPSIVGRDTLVHGALTGSLATSRKTAAFIRPLSLIEMALWDVVAKQARLPLHVLLGGAGGTSAPLMAVAFFTEDRGEEATLDDLEQLEAEGFTFLKLMIAARPPQVMHSFLARAKERLGPDTRLAVDLFFSISTLEQGIRLLHALDELELEFVEDPFAPAAWRQLVSLRDRCRTPLAAGEHVVSTLEYRDLLEAVSILRVDPSCSGGFSAAIAGIHLAAVGGAMVVPHGVPGANAQLAGAFSAVTAIEVIPPKPLGDEFGRLAGAPYEVRNGAAYFDNEPGAGLRLDWDAVVASASATWST